MRRTVDMKIVLLGNAYVGKTSLLDRYLFDRFQATTPYQTTIGAAFASPTVQVGGRTMMLGIWDTAGSEKYESMSRIYYRGANAAIVCYDLTDKHTFERAKFWARELQQSVEGCKVYLCGTKKDLLDEDKSLRQVDFRETTDYANEINSELVETSSKSGDNIRQLFYKIASDFVSVPLLPVEEDLNSFQLEEGDTEASAWRCTSYCSI